MMVSHNFGRKFNPDALYMPEHLLIGALPTCPIILEIGAGKGKHAMQLSAQNPTSHIIAIERTKEKFCAFAKAIQQGNFENLTAIHADAVVWTVHALPPKSLDKVFILYPNPEPKNKNQRFVNMPFFEFLLSRLKDGGQLIIASNIPEYITEAAQMLDDTWKLPFCKHKIEASSARTHFEIKYLARGELCQELIITKPEGYRTHFDEWVKG